MPSKSMYNIKQVAEKYVPILPMEAGNMEGRHRAALQARLQSLVKGEEPEKPGDSL